MIASATLRALALHSRITFAERSRNWIRYCTLSGPQPRSSAQAFASRYRARSYARSASATRCQLAGIRPVRRNHVTLALASLPVGLGVGLHQPASFLAMSEPSRREITGGPHLLRLECLDYRLEFNYQLRRVLHALKVRIAYTILCQVKIVQSDAKICFTRGATVTSPEGSRCSIHGHLPRRLGEASFICWSKRMTKAAIVIGVNKTGDLPVLRDAAAGAGRVAAWLKSEGYLTQALLDEKTPGVFTPVRAHDIFTAVEAALKPGTCEQLVIYFSGHGYLNDSSEHWLLSDAPSNPNEAISVEENILLARDCGVPNVAFVSDACRSTPQSIKADRVRGTMIFPNTGVSATARADVDRFFACLPGDPAYEVAVDKSSGVYSALFTHCLQDAYIDTPKALTSDVGGVEVLPNRKLKKLLPPDGYLLPDTE